MIWDARAAGAVDSDGWIPLIRQLDSIVSVLAVLVSEMTTPQATLFLLSSG